MAVLHPRSLVHLNGNQNLSGGNGFIKVLFDIIISRAKEQEDKLYLPVVGYRILMIKVRPKKSLEKYLSNNTTGGMPSNIIL